MRGVMRRPVVVLALFAVVAALLAPALVSPRTVEGAEPEAHFEPASGTCGHAWVVAGSGYPARSLVSLGIPSMTEIKPVTETRTDADGSFRVVLPDAFAVECRPGTLLGISAVAGEGASRVFRIAAYEIASPYQLRTVACSGHESTFEGAGYAPGLSIPLIWTADRPFVDNAAIVGTVVTDRDGRFVATFRIGCLPEGDTITAGGARLDSTATISPAATGHGLARTTGRGVPIALAILALATLGTARHVGARRPLS